MRPERIKNIVNGNLNLGEEQLDSRSPGYLTLAESYLKGRTELYILVG